MRSNMMKYRIIRLDLKDHSVYCIQKKFLFFWWIDLNSTGGYTRDFPYHYSSLEEARAALRWFNPKKTVIDVEYQNYCKW